MSILFVLIPLSLVLLGLAVWSLFWAIDTGQFENLDEAARGFESDDDPRDGEPGLTPPAPPRGERSAS